MNTNKQNPYADENGRPKTGKMHQFFKWQCEQEDKKRKGLTTQQLKELEAKDKHLHDKMNS
jgi:hypothetical protein